MTDAQKAAQEILQMLQRHGVVYVNRVLFEGRSPQELEAIQQRIQRIIDKNLC